jgi:hypothetical protein
VGVVGTLLTAGKGVPAWQRWDATQRISAEEHVRQVTMAREGVGLLPAMRDSLATRTERVQTLMEQLVRANSVPQAAASLASVLAADADWAGIKVFTLSVRPDSAARDGFALVGVRVTAVGDVDGVTRYLRRVEVDSLLLAVRELTVSQPEPGAPQDKVETLHLDLLVEALARIDTSHSVSGA